MEAYLKLHHYVFGNMKPYIRVGRVNDLNDSAHEFVEFYGNNLFGEFVERD